MGKSEESFVQWLVDVVTCLEQADCGAAACAKLLKHLSSGTAEASDFRVLFHPINMHGAPAVSNFSRSTHGLLCCILKGLKEHPGEQVCHAWGLSCKSPDSIGLPDGALGR